MTTPPLFTPDTRIEGDAKPIAWAVCSHLLSYPDAEILERIDLLQEAIQVLPEPHRSRLHAFMGTLEAADRQETLSDLQELYVETFDTRRRSALYLTYFAHGDTRRRGMAILEIKQALAADGFDAGDRELPDHLSVILEYAGTVNPEKGEAFLRAYRPGLEMVRLSLLDKRSPWAVVLQTVCATLAALESDDRAAVERLIAEGPDEELVGLSAYGSDADYQAGPPTTSKMAWDPTGTGFNAAGVAGGAVPLPMPKIPSRVKEPRHG